MYRYNLGYDGILIDLIFILLNNRYEYNLFSIYMDGLELEFFLNIIDMELIGLYKYYRNFMLIFLIAFC